ncbi:hypothetical protein Hanom_Chr16g01474891 [Helianthus anomalus]
MGRFDVLCSCSGKAPRLLKNIYITSMTPKTPGGLLHLRRDTTTVCVFSQGDAKSNHLYICSGTPSSLEVLTSCHQQSNTGPFNPLRQGKATLERLVGIQL